MCAAGRIARSLVGIFALLAAGNPFGIVFFVGLWLFSILTVLSVGTSIFVNDYRCV